MGINIDGITRTKTTIVGDERMVGRDDLGDFKVTIDDLLESLAGKLPPGMMIEYVADGDPAVNGDRVILQQGQTVLIADYQAAFDKVYKDQTTPAFFKCDVDGTPNPSGLYFIMQDRRGLVPRGIGDAIINGRTKTGPSCAGAIQEDEGQKITGNISFYCVGRNVAGSLAATGALNGTTYNYRADSTTADADQGLRTITFDSANSPDARTSTTTAGETRVSTLGTQWGLTY